MSVILDGAQALRPLDTFTISYGATTALATDALKSRLIRLHTTAEACVGFSGLAGTATGVAMSAGQTEYFQVATQWTLSAISNDGTSGALNVTECG